MQHLVFGIEEASEIQKQLNKETITSLEEYFIDELYLLKGFNYHKASGFYVLEANAYSGIQIELCFQIMFPELELLLLFKQ